MRRAWSTLLGMTQELLVVHVQVQVLPQFVEAFREATLANASASLQEPGVARFDVVQEREDATRFVLVEVYRSEQAPLDHKQTAHYARWRDAVEPMMAAPRSSRKFRALFPGREAW